MTALQITEDPWLNNKRLKGNRGKDRNIVDMMKEFRNETAPSSANSIARVVRGLVSSTDYFLLNLKVSKCRVK